MCMGGGPKAQSAPPPPPPPPPPIMPPTRVDPSVAAGRSGAQKQLAKRASVTTSSKAMASADTKPKTLLGS